MRKPACGRAPRIIAALLAAATTAAAAAPAGEGFPLFTGLRDDPRAALTLDIDPALPGLDHPFVDFFSCQVSAPDVDGNITATLKVKLKAKNPDGSALSFNTGTTAASVTSGKFADPRLAQHQCDGATPADYHESYESLTLDRPGRCFTVGDPAEFCFELPLQRVGLGIASKNGTRVVVVGTGLKGVQERPTFTRYGRFAVTVFNLDGTRRWTKLIPHETNTFRMFEEWSLVGDFLNGDGNDEIRVTYMGDGAYKYVYYDVLSGSVIKNVVVP